MKIKTKLILGIGALFVLIVVLALLSGLYINKLSADTKNIVADNHASISYCREMLLALDSMTITKDPQKFLNYLQKQKQNITETGELEATQKIEKDFTFLQSDTANKDYYRILRKDLIDIIQLNMDAIRHKGKTAENTADTAISWITIAGTLCFLIAFILLFNLPATIANPIRDLTNSIKNIAAQNYKERVHVASTDEFGDMATAFNTMAEKLEEYNNSNMARIMIEKQRIETLINNMHEPVIGLDAERNIIFINSEALHIAGLQSTDVIGKPVQDIAVQNDLIRLLIKDLFGEKPSKEPIRIYANEKESYFQKDNIPIKIKLTGETEEEYIGDVIILQNITLYKELDFAKTNFIATVSHELKTPISSIKMSAQLLENPQVGALNTEQKELIQGINEDITRLLKIIGELLNATQLESGIIELKPQSCRPDEIIAQAISANKINAEVKHITLQTTIPDNLPNVYVDKDKTTWVMNNLISNAIRHSYEDTIVNISAQEIPGFIKFSVKDTGQGIAPQFLDKIFDRYFRVPGTKKEGTGLGLAISKQFIEAQGGKIEVHSELGTGSEFEVLIPLSA